jgi:hypothetical protein
VSGRFVGRGSRLSLAAVGRELMANSAALQAAMAALAEDVAIWEQRGCLSPQVLLVETDSAASLARVAEALLAALDQRARVWPPPGLSVDEKAAVARFVNAVEWGVEGEEQARVVRGSGGIVVVGGALRPTCLHRTVRVNAVAELETIGSMLGSSPIRVESVGLAVDAARSSAVRAALIEAGVPRPCALGEMQRPDLSWKPGGVARVKEWMR